MGYFEGFVEELFSYLLDRKLESDWSQAVADQYRSLMKRFRQFDHGLPTHFPPAGILDHNHRSWNEGSLDGFTLTGSREYSPLGIFVADAAVQGKENGVEGENRKLGNCDGRQIPADLKSTIAETRQRLIKGELSAEELVELALRRVEETEPQIHAFFTVVADEAQAQARQIDKRLRDSTDRQRLLEEMPLVGIPVGLKDVIDTAGIRTTYGSKIFHDYLPQEDAWVQKQLTASGAILVGKLSNHEFARGATNRNEHFGDTRNPWDLTRMAGGSSGGAGAAVAAASVFVGMGSDTGGSVRSPAALCGIVGFKPTYGLVGTEGVWPATWSMDHVGPMTRTVMDAALVLSAIAGQNPRELTSCRVEIPNYMDAVRKGQDGAIKGMRVGIDELWLKRMVDPAVVDSIDNVLRKLEALGAEIIPIELPSLTDMIVVYRVVNLAESGSRHRYLLPERYSEYGKDVRLPCELGQMILAGDYILGQRLRTAFTRYMLKIMQDIDVIVTPTAPVGAPKLEALQINWECGVENVPEALTRFEVPFNLTGQPALSVPCGLDSLSLPIGVQIVGKPFGEADVLRLGASCEQLVDWRIWPEI